MVVSFAVKQSNGSLRTGLVAGDFTVTAVNPADSATTPPAVSESAQKAGLYQFTIPSSFFTTHGVGLYRFVVEVDTIAGPSGAPNVRDAFSGVVRAQQEDIDTLADGGAGTYNRTTDSQEDIRDAIPAASAVATAVWSEPVPGAFGGGTAGFILGTNLDALVSSRASQASVTAIQNVTRVAISLPKLLIPDSGGPTLYKLYLNLFDTAGNPEDPDADTITVTAENHAAASRTANLGGGGTMTKLATGRYEITYSVATTHAIEQLIFRFTYAENAISFTQDRTTDAVATLEDNFTAADRATLTSISGRIPVVLVGGRMDSSIGAVQTGAITAAGFAAGAIDAAAIATDAITAAKIAADAIGASELAASAVAEIQAAVLSDATPFPGANIDATISSRASQTTADEIKRGLVAHEFTAAAGSSPGEVRSSATQADGFFDGATLLVRNAVGVVPRRVSQYTNLNGAFFLDDDLPFTPAPGDLVIVVGPHSPVAGAVG
jgi:hypothetical protein